MIYPDAKIKQWLLYGSNPEQKTRPGKKITNIELLQNRENLSRHGCTTSSKNSESDRDPDPQNTGFFQWCGSGMFIQDPIFPSRIRIKEYRNISI